MYKNNSLNLIWADNLRAIATTSVIILHVVAPILDMYGNTANSTWWFGNIIDSIVRFCVPIFVMLTGALVLTKDYDIGVY